MSRIPDSNESENFQLLLASADLKKEQYFLSSNLIEIILKNIKTTVFDIEYMKVPNEIPKFTVSPYIAEYNLENRGNRFLDLKNKIDNELVIECKNRNISYEIPKNHTAYAYSGTKVYARTGSRVFAYEGSKIIASKNSIVLANKGATIYAFVGAKIFENKYPKDGNIIKPMHPIRVMTQTKIFNCVFIRPFIYQGGKYSYICTAGYDYPSKINLENIIRIKKSKLSIQEFMNCKNNIKVFNKTIYKTTHNIKKFTWKDFNSLLEKWGHSLINWDKGRVNKVVINFDIKWYNRYFYPEISLITSNKKSNKISSFGAEVLSRLIKLERFQIRENDIILNNFYYAEVKEFYSLVALHSIIETPNKILDAVDEVCINSLSDPMGLVQGNQFSALIAFSPRLAPYVLSRKWPENRIIKRNDNGVLRD